MTTTAIVPAARADLVNIQDQVPALYARDELASKRTFEFFAVSIRNPNTRKAYAHAASEFATWCEAHGIADVRQVQPVHVAAYIEGLQIAAPSVKQRLAALRMLFDWLVVSQVLPSNPASAVRGPRHSVQKSKTPVLSAKEARALLESIDVSTPIGLRDRALISLMVYTFARVGAVLQMRREDVFVQGHRLWVRLHEKGGKAHEMPCHHHLEAWLQAYLEQVGPPTDDAELSEAPGTASRSASPLHPGKAWLFRSSRGRSGTLSALPLRQADVFRMIGRRAEAAGLRTHIGCHSFRATGITEYLRNGGKLEIAQRMANHASARTTGLYDRRADQIHLDDGGVHSNLVNQKRQHDIFIF